jgi:exonuclease III
MAGITTYLSILILNVNGLNSPIKRHHLANWIKKEDSTICCLQETHLIDRNKHWLRVKGWKNIYQANSPPKQAGVAILISDKIEFKLTLIK